LKTAGIQERLPVNLSRNYGLFSRT